MKKKKKTPAAEPRVGFLLTPGIKRPVNECFDQPYFVAKYKGCKAKKIGKHTREGLFSTNGGDREVWGFVF